MATSTDYESSFEARSAAVFGNDASSEPAGEPNGAPPAPSPDAPTASPADSGDADAQRAARRQALAELQARERASVDAKQRQKGDEELRAALAAAEKRAEEAERMAAQRIDVETLTEDQFFEHARKARVSPQRLGEWLREQAQNPELVAAREATKVIDPKISALEKRVAEQQELIDSFLKNQESARVAAEEEHLFSSFSSFTTESATTSPRAAAFLREFGPAEYRKIVNSAVARVPEGAGAQAVLDEIEENLSALARIYAAPAAAAKPSIPQPNSGAAKPMTTVSNTLAQTRASVVDEEAEWASLPFEERSARLFGRG